MAGPDYEKFAARVAPLLLRDAYLLTGDHHQAQDLVRPALDRRAGTGLVAGARGPGGRRGGRRAARCPGAAAHRRGDFLVLKDRDEFGSVYWVRTPAGRTSALTVRPLADGWGVYAVTETCGTWTPPTNGNS